MSRLAIKVRGYVYRFCDVPLIRFCFANPVMRSVMGWLETQCNRSTLPVVRTFSFAVFVSYFRFFGSQEEHAVSSPLFGTLFVSRLDYIGSRIYAFHVWEPAITWLIRQHLGKEDIFIDIGSNIGYYTLLAARRCHKVISFEASPVIFGKLQQHVTLNQVSNVELHNCALLDKAGTVDIYLAPDRNLGISSIFSAKEHPLKVQVPAKTLSNFLDVDALAQVKIVKIDVEGAEPLILEDMYSMLSRFPEKTMFVIEIFISDLEGKFAVSPETLLKPFIDAGYRFYIAMNVQSTNAYVFPDKTPHFKEVQANALNRMLTDRNPDLVITKSAL